MRSECRQKKVIEIAKVQYYANASSRVRAEKKYCISVIVSRSLRVLSACGVVCGPATMNRTDRQRAS